MEEEQNPPEEATSSNENINGQLARENEGREEYIEETNTQIPPHLNLEEIFDNENEENEIFENMENEILDESEGIDHTQPHPSNQNDKTIYEKNWEIEYKNCPTFKEMWENSQNGVWEKSIQIFGDKMYLNDMLCVPLGLQKLMINEHHEFLGHVGSTRLWTHMEIKYLWANEKLAKKILLTSHKIL